MDNLDDSENNAKISDSAYSNSCSNSQSRRSRSSKSTHSGSNSSGSSGYGGKPLTSGFSNNIGDPSKPEKRTKDKDGKKKKAQVEINATEGQAQVESSPPEPIPLESPKEEDENVAQSLSPEQDDIAVENMDVATPESYKEETHVCNVGIGNALSCMASRLASSYSTEGIGCVISMQNGIVVYITPSLTIALGYPKDMWVGRSFMDFIHPRDRDTLSTHICNAMSTPNANESQEKAPNLEIPVSKIVCRIRRYRGLSAGFGVKERVVLYSPYLLRLSIKIFSNEKGFNIYVVIKGIPVSSAFKSPNEAITKSTPFVIKHGANGNLEYIDPESVPYLGYLPQDVINKDAIQLYHPDDLGYLRQVYETVMKEGALSRSESYRMMTQNGDYLRLETEWTSFINPWSRKLEFIIGKHHVIEGPKNPDIFASPKAKGAITQTEEERNETQTIREDIVRLLNEVPTRPAEIAKQQMNKRCQELSLIIDNLLDEPSDFGLEMNYPEHSHYERDSVMLGGISPHHDYDSMSSTETPINYNQLNYDETLQRFFDSMPFVPVDMDNGISTNEKEFDRHYYYFKYDTNNDDIMEVGNDTKDSLRSSIQKMPNSTDSVELTSSCESGTMAAVDCQSRRLNESRIKKHNNEMEKVLVKKHRESRTINKEDKEKLANEVRQKMKEHLARCNALYLPGPININEHTKKKTHGIKRTSKNSDSEAGAHKHHCSSPRQPRRKFTTSAAPVASSPTITTTVGMIPMYYAPTGTHVPSNSEMTNPSPMRLDSNHTNTQYQQPAMQCMMYGQAVYGSPIMYSPITPQVMPMQGVMAQNVQYNNLNTFGLDSRNYEEACKASLLMKPAKSHSSSAWSIKNRAESAEPKSSPESGSNVSVDALNRNTEIVAEPSPSNKSKATTRLGTSDMAIDKTDEESSYSSFYSSFFKTESGSAEDSGDPKNKNSEGTQNTYYEPAPLPLMSLKKIQPSWMEQVCVTSELIYRYQVLTRPLDEVLKADKQKMIELEQPSLVNEQLGQLYLDLQLEGVAARLTLEEGITSSGSSGEESTSSLVKTPRKKRDYHKLVLIHEENSPMPAPPNEEAPRPSTS